MEWLLLVLLGFGIPFILPIAAWVTARRTRARLLELQEIVEQQRVTIEGLEAFLLQFAREARTPHGDVRPVAAVPASHSDGSAGTRPAPTVAVPPAAASVPPTRTAPPPPPAPSASPTPTTVPAITPPAPTVASPPSTVAPTPPSPSAPPLPPPPTGATPRELPSSWAPGVPKNAIPPPAAGAPRSQPLPPPAVPPPPRRPSPPEPPMPSGPWLDWENLIGVKLFSAIAGVALVLAAVFFLRYSIEHGWLQPPVRVAIGLVVAIALLAVCELKAARQYPATANALDAAAIAILFSTFFAAHALWNLIPAPVAFGLLVIVTALAVLLSIRRESLFIAVLGLLGGFATPALLSTGENRPIPLFAYLMLLNVGLAWVAYRQRWPILTVLTLVFTTLYQWGWVLKFLTRSDLSLAMGIFIVFPIVTFAALAIGRSRAAVLETQSTDAVFERTALVAAILPLFFAIYLAAVPEYGARPWLLFGFLFVIDVGLFAVAVARRQDVLHAAGALATLLVSAVWLATSYTTAGASAALTFSAVFVALYACAPPLADRAARPLAETGRGASYAAPLLLFVPTVLAGIEPSFAAPLPLFAMLLASVLVIAWRAAVERRGSLYYLAAFFAIAAQAVWSAQHLTAERLATAVVLYTVFGLVAILIPTLARRVGRTLEPVQGGGWVLIASLGLLLFLSASPSIAPTALWALALLLAIVNAGLFVESAAGRLPLVAIVGSALSWIILASWWWRAAGAVGVLPSLTVLAGLTLVTLGGHAWARARVPLSDREAGFAQGLYLGLTGHLFLLFVAANREWSLPPWPVFGTLTVLTLATSAVSFLTRVAALHAAGAIAAAVVVAFWTGVAGASWVIVALITAAVVSAYALSWIPLWRRVDSDGVAAAAAAAVLFIGEVTVILTSAVSASPPFAPMLAAHVTNLSIILMLTWQRQWSNIALLAVGAAWAALLQFEHGHDLTATWRELLTLSTVLYVVFVAYPLALGSRTRRQHDPYVAAVLASAMFFFSARAAFDAGGLSGLVGIVPVTAALVLAILLRQLLRIEPAGARNIGRLALVAGAALAFVTVAIPLQLRHQWITIGWALEGAALAWLYRRVPHRGLLYASVALLAAVFVRLALNPAVLEYEPRGALRIFNWYLYTYVIAAASLFAASWWLAQTDEQLGESLPRPSRALPAAAVVLLFLLLNIEIADYFATGPTVMFRFGASVSQDLTYTIGWLLFGMALLAVGIYLKNRSGRVAAVTLIAVTTFKCFLYDLGSFGGLYRVASLVGLAMSLSLVALALQKYVLARPENRI